MVIVINTMLCHIVVEYWLNKLKFFLSLGRRQNFSLSALSIVRVPKVDIYLETYIGSLKSTLLYDPMIKSESPIEDERKWEVNLSPSTPHSQYLLFLMVAIAYTPCSLSLSSVLSTLKPESNGTIIPRPNFGLQSQRRRLLVGNFVS